MNIYFIIGAALLIIFVMFGRDPFAERREKLAKFGGDPLVAAIAEHNSKTGGSGGILGGGGMMPQNTGGTTATQPTYPAYMMPNGQNAFSNANPYKKQYYQAKNPYRAGTPGQAPAQGNSYYPPPPLSGSARPSPLQVPSGPGSQLEPEDLPVPLGLSPSSKTAYLRSGEKLGFAGSRVYTFNDKGNPVTLPDGTYAMNDGRTSITVKNGKRVLISN